MRLILLLALGAALACGRYVEQQQREKREVEYHEWLTAEQKDELKKLQDSADSAALKKRTMELYELLPAAEKEKWNAKYKEMCVAWIKETATDEEKANYQKWKTEGKMEEIKTQYNKLKERLTDHKRKDVELWESECWSLWKDEFPASRGRRSVMDLAEEKLSFLGAEKIAELKQLKESGASDDVIRDKVVSWTLAHWKAGNTGMTTADFVKKCYDWIKDVTTATEYEAFEKLHHTDHEACRVKVREFLTRLAEDKKEKVERSLPLCDAIWYKQHQEEHGAHGGHDGHDHKAHKHHVARRETHEEIREQFKQFFTWLTPEQAKEIQALGNDEEKVDAKIKEYYAALDGTKKTEAGDLLKGACKHFFSQAFGPAVVEEIKQMKESGADMDVVEKKVGEHIAALTDDKKKALATRAANNCKQLFKPAARARRDMKDLHEELKVFFDWLSPEQAAAIKALKDAGDFDGVDKKMEEAYKALEGAKKNEAQDKLKGACKHFFSKTFGAAAVEEIKQLKEAGNKDEIDKKVTELLSKITDDKAKAMATRASVNCKKIFEAARARRELPPDHEEYKPFFAWLTPEQGAAVKALAADPDAMDAKIKEYYGALSGDKKTEAQTQLKGFCKHYFGKVFGTTAVEEIKEMKEAGTSMDDIGKKVEEFINKIGDEKLKAQATRTSLHCKKLFTPARMRRDHPDEEFKQFFDWLTPEQGKELKELRAAGKEAEVYDKIETFYAALTGDNKQQAAEKLKGGCKHFFNKVFGDAAVAEIKQLKESGASHDAIGNKVSELISKIDDDKKKAVATRASLSCKKIFGASRKRRNQDPHAEYRVYFGWLTPEQAAETKALGEKGDHEGVYKKVDAFYEALSGDKRAEARTQLQGACKHFFKATFGEAAVEEIKQMKEAGAAEPEIVKKVEELIAKIDDPKKKEVAGKASGNCKKYFAPAKRARRDKAHTPEEHFEMFTPWMTAEQKTEMKALMATGDDAKFGAKVWEFYEALDASKKEDAKTNLQSGCRHVMKDLLGDAASAELKQLHETAATPADMAKKVDELIGKMADGVEKTKATGLLKNCKKIYGVPSRKRRDNVHTPEEHLAMFVPWLTDAQKAEIKALKESGAEAKIGEKILEFYEAIDPSKKDDAKQKLQEGCRHFLKDVLGPAVSTELKQMHEAGASPVEIAKKVDEAIGKMEDGEKKAQAQGITKNCKKVYGVPSRKRREHHEHNLDQIMTQFLSWTTEEQKMELKNMKEAGAKDKIGDKVMEYYEAVAADKKDEARTQLQGACRHFLKDLLGDAMATEMKQMHEAGSTPAEMAKKLDELITKMEDGEKKAKAEGLSKNCRKVYGVARRKRRDHHEHTLEEVVGQFLGWLSEEQKMELKNMNEAGAKDKLGAKVMEYFDNVDASKKDEARTQLQGACRHFTKHLMGAEVTETMKQLKESGAEPAEMAKKFEEFIEKMTDAEKKTKAKDLAKNCRKVYGVAARRRRDLYGEYDQRYQQYYSWLSEEQKEQLESLSDSGENDALLLKVSEYFAELEESRKDEARGQLKMGCRMRMRDLVGEAKSDEIRQMKEDGASKQKMLDKLAEFVAEMEEGEAKRTAQRSYKFCAKILSRTRRQSGEGFGRFTLWLKEEQRQELNTIMRSDPDSIYDKMFSYLEELEGNERYEADTQMKGACRHFLLSFLGESQATKLKQLRETGKRWQDIEHTLDGMISAIPDEKGRNKARSALGHCKQFWRPT